MLVRFMDTRREERMGVRTHAYGMGDVEFVLNLAAAPTSAAEVCLWLDMMLLDQALPLAIGCRSGRLRLLEFGWCDSPIEIDT